MSRKTGESAQQMLSLVFVHSAWGMLGLVMFVSLVMLWPSWTSLSSVWLNWSDYSHGYLVAVICLGLIFRQRSSIRTSRCEPWGWGILLLVLLGFAWLVARLASVEIVELVLLPVLVWTLCLITLGWQISRKLLFPLFFLYFAIPIWHWGNPILQQITVEVVEYLVKIAGFPAYIQGNFVFLVDGTFEIADGCSGLHYFIAAITIATLYGYLDFEKPRDRIYLLLAFALAAMIGNWLRVFTVIYAGYATKMQHYLVTVDHYYFGWLLFALILLPIFLVSRRFQSSRSSQTNPTVDETMPGSASGGVKVTSIKLLIVAAAFMALMTLWSTINMNSTATIVATVEAPAGTTEWVLSESSGQDWQPVFAGANHELINDYNNEGNVVTLYMNRYADESQGKELVGYYNKIEGVGWKVDASSIISLEPEGKDKLNARMLTLTSISNKHRVVLYWYEVNGYRTANELNAKILQGISRLSGSTTAGVVALSAKCMLDDCELAQLQLDNWLNEVWLER